jgi:hypothetical protein
MGTIASPWRYDFAAYHALQSVSALDLALRLANSDYPSIAALSINPGIDVMGHEPTSHPAGSNPPAVGSAPIQARVCHITRLAPEIM